MVLSLKPAGFGLSTIHLANNLEREGNFMINKEEIYGKMKSMRLPMFIMVCLCYMFTPFHRMAPAIMGPDLMKELNLTAVDFGSLGLTFMVAFAVAQAPCGILLDRLGPRKGMTIVLMMTAVGSFMFSTAQSLLMINVARAIIALALGGFLIGGAKIVSQWYTTSQYPVLWAMFMGFGTMGGIGATSPLQFMMTNFGWRSSFAIIAGVSVVIAILTYLILRDRPADVGLPAPDELAGEAAPAAQTAAAKSGITAIKELVCMPKMWLSALLVIGVTSSGQALTALWGGVFLADVYNFSKPVIGDILFASAVGAVVGCFAAGWLMKKIKITGVLITGTAGFLLLWVYMLLSLRTLGVMELKVIMFLMGVVHMYVIACNFTLVKTLVPGELLGTGMGLVNMCAFIFGAGVFQQIWGFMINTISKGVKPFPVEAFEAAMWLQAVFLVISTMCAVYFVKNLNKPAVSVSTGQ